MSLRFRMTLAGALSSFLIGCSTGGGGGSSNYPPEGGGGNPLHPSPSASPSGQPTPPPIRLEYTLESGQSQFPCFGPDISGDGTKIVFQEERGLRPLGYDTHILVRDLQSNTLVEVGPGPASTSIWFNSMISADGRFVAFNSPATDLVAGDTLLRAKVFREDLTTGAIVLVSADPGGAPVGAGMSSISGDGDKIVFLAGGPGEPPVVPGAPSSIQVYVRSIQAATTSWVSSDSGSDPLSNPYAGISRDGSQVGFYTDGSSSSAFIKNLTSGSIALVSAAPDGGPADGQVGSSAVQGSYSLPPIPALSADGRFVAFQSSATNLVANDTNSKNDVFVRDTVAAITRRVSLSSSGAQSDLDSSYPDISDDGRFVVYQRAKDSSVPAPNRELYLFDASNSRTLALTPASAENDRLFRDCFDARISGDGSRIVFVGGASDGSLRIYSVANPFAPPRPNP